MNMHLQRNSSAANYARKIRYGYRFANNIDPKVARKIEYDHKFANSIAPHLLERSDMVTSLQTSLPPNMLERLNMKPVFKLLVTFHSLLGTWE